MKPNLKELFFASFDYEEYNPQQTKMLLLNAMFFITIIINLIFMFINIFIAHTYLMFFVNLFIVSFLGYALYLLREKSQYNIASYIGNAILFISFLSIVILKESASYSMIWTLFFAPFAILTLGAKKGFMLSIVFMTIVIASSYTGIDIWDNGRWNFETFFRMIVGLIVMLYVIYAIQNNNEKANVKIERLRQKEKIQLQLLQKLSITDTLTSLYNRRFFEEIFPRQIKRAINNKELLTFFTLDLDYFKQYNDTYGHQKGDWALVQIAEILNEIFGKSDDYIFRMGGEEFAGIFLDGSVENIRNLIEQIPEKLKERNIEHKGNPQEDILTASIGVYMQEMRTDINHQEIYRLADEALYRAKSQGKNQIVYV